MKIVIGLLALIGFVCGHHNNLAEHVLLPSPQYKNVIVTNERFGNGAFAYRTIESEPYQPVVPLVRTVSFFFEGI